MLNRLHNRMTPERLIRIVSAWLLVGLFIFPIYYWATVAIKVPADIFALPPKIFDFSVSFQSFEEVFGVSFDGLSVVPGGGDFYMTPRLVDSIFIAVASTVLTIMIATMASYALSRLPFSGQHHFVFWILSTRMMPPVAVAIPLFFMYKEMSLLDTYTGIILVHALMNLPLAVLLLKSFFDDIPLEIDESALVSGASRILIFRKIVLPMVMGESQQQLSYALFSVGQSLCLF